MSRKSKKTKLIDIMTGILREYEQDIHETSTETCGLCVEYIEKNQMFGSFEECGRCPMYAFKSHGIPCLRRKCRPVGTHFVMSDREMKLKRVKMFYTQVIARIESMSVAAVRKSKFKFLKKIDNDVAKEFKLNNEFIL